MTDDIHATFDEYEKQFQGENPYRGIDPGNPGDGSRGAPSEPESESGPTREPKPREPLTGYEIKTVELNELLAKELPPRNLMLSPWLPENGLAMIFAGRGIGKTYFALEIAIAAATGTEFLGWRAQRPYRVLYLDGEMCASDLQERLKKICGSDPRVKEGFFQLVTPDMQVGACPDLSSPRWQQSLEPLLEGIDLIVVDNISTLCRTGTENEAESWAPVQAWAIQQRSAGRSVLFIHHAGKSGAQRGTSKREDIMDTVISLSRPDDYREEEGARFVVKFTKARGFAGDGSKPFEAWLESNDEVHRWQSDALPETTYDAVVRLLNEGASQKEVAEKLSIDKSTVSRYCKQGKQEGALKSDSE